jgi:aminoglycoside 6'-N-acetyltransferase
MVQYGEDEEPAYRHASIDIFLDPVVHRQGVGRDAILTLARYLVRLADGSPRRSLPR